MPYERKEITTSKKLSALRQINAAIEHFHNGEFECAITLAAAAEGLLPDGQSPSLFRELVQRATDLDFNLFINWLKHPVAPEKVTISDFEAAMIIARAISKFFAVYSQSTRRFEEFAVWAREAGLIPPDPEKSN
ncbi:MAG: hypothetical protein ABSB37_14000 [Xanthobacteraceae bacterium]|jgi:hypothetical protein